MYEEKTVKINKSAKLKSLKQIIDLCLKNNMLVEGIDKDGITIENPDGYESVTLPTKLFGKNVSIKYVELEFNDDGEVVDEKYHTKSLSLPKEFGVFFTSFPKLTAEQQTPPPLPPELTVVDTLSSSDNGLNYDLELREDNTVKVGCGSVLNREQQLNVYNFLGKCLLGSTENNSN